MLVQTGWKPSRRNITYEERPPEIPEWVYIQAITAKRQFNENWEFWVWQVSQDHNCSQAIAEDACIRGIKKEILRHRHIYGDAIGDWFERFLDMKDIFNKVSHPEYVNQLGDKIIER
jgi:hypothetical protein